MALPDGSLVWTNTAWRARAGCAAPAGGAASSAALAVATSAAIVRVGRRLMLDLLSVMGSTFRLCPCGLQRHRGWPSVHRLVRTRLRHTALPAAVPSAATRARTRPL